MNYNVINKSSEKMYLFARMTKKLGYNPLTTPIKNFYSEGIEHPGISRYLQSIQHGFVMTADKCTFTRTVPADKNGLLKRNLFNRISDAINSWKMNRNIKKAVKNNPELAELKSAFDEKYNTLYPRSAKLREKILNRKRFPDAIVGTRSN